MRYNYRRCICWFMRNDAFRIFTSIRENIQIARNHGKKMAYNEFSKTHERINMIFKRVQRLIRNRKGSNRREMKKIIFIAEERTSKKMKKYWRKRKDFEKVYYVSL